MPLDFSYFPNAECAENELEDFKALFDLMSNKGSDQKVCFYPLEII